MQHDRCAMKVGTDALVLGAWVQLPKQGKVLDVGAGSGILSLMMAQRSAGQLSVTALELDVSAAQQAQENVDDSPWRQSITVVHADALLWQPQASFAMIISNPPFFNHSLGSPNPERHDARHTDNLPHSALLARAAAWLIPSGQLHLILPITSALPLLNLARSTGWWNARQCMVYPSPSKPPHRMLLSLQREPCETHQSELFIHDAQGGYSQAYQQLTRDFYLRF